MQVAAVQSRAELVNPRWVISTLKGRGITTPTVKSTQSTLTAMSAADVEVFRDRVMRAHRGIDAPGDLEALAQWARDVQPEQDDQPAPKMPVKISNRSRTDSIAAAAANDVAGRLDGSKSGIERVTSNPRSWEPSHHIYGSKAALSVETTEVISEPRTSNDRQESFWTLQVEIAPSLTKQRYDWDRKIVFRLTKRELPLLAAVLFGWTGKITFANHGSANDKEFTVEDQGSHLYVKLRQGKKIFSLPVGGEELFTLTAFVLRGLCKNAPDLDSQTVLQIIKRAGLMYARSVGEVV